MRSLFHVNMAPWSNRANYQGVPFIRVPIIEVPRCILKKYDYCKNFETEKSPHRPFLHVTDDMSVKLMIDSF